MFGSGSVHWLENCTQYVWWLAVAAFTARLVAAARASVVPALATVEAVAGEVAAMTATTAPAATTAMTLRMAPPRARAQNSWAPDPAPGTGRAGVRTDAT